MLLIRLRPVLNRRRVVSEHACQPGRFVLAAGQNLPGFEVLWRELGERDQPEGHQDCSRPEWSEEGWR